MPTINEVLNQITDVVRMNGKQVSASTFDQIVTAIPGHLEVLYKHLCFLADTGDEKRAVDTSVSLDNAISDRNRLFTQNHIGYALQNAFIQLSNTCNLRCTMCPTHIWDSNTGQMTEETFRTCIEKLKSANVRSLTFAGQKGETLIHKNAIDWIRFAVENGFAVTITTNGTLLTRDKIKQLLDTGLSEMMISFTGHDKVSYESQYCGANFESICDSMQYTYRSIVDANLKTKFIVNSVISSKPSLLGRQTMDFLGSLGIPRSSMRVTYTNNWGALSLNQIKHFPLKEWTCFQRSELGFVNLSVSESATMEEFLPASVLTHKTSSSLVTS